MPTAKEREQPEQNEKGSQQIEPARQPNHGLRPCPVENEQSRRHPRSHPRQTELRGKKQNKHRIGRMQIGSTRPASQITDSGRVPWRMNKAAATHAAIRDKPSFEARNKTSTALAACRSDRPAPPAKSRTPAVSRGE